MSRGHLKPITNFHHVDGRDLLPHGPQKISLDHSMGLVIIPGDCFNPSRNAA